VQSKTADLLWVIGIYALSKAAEALDQALLNTTTLLSGHTLKHLIATVAVFWLLRMLSKRTPEPLAQSGNCSGREKLL
jgi:hypothetical protein